MTRPVTLDSARCRASVAAVLGLSLALVMGAPSARATTLERMSVEQMASRGARVVIGTVTGVTYQPSGDSVRTAVVVAVEQSLKGAPAKSVTVYVPGGLLPGGDAIVVPDMATFRLGERVCVFADRNGWVMGGFQGKVGIANGRATSGDSVTGLRTRILAGVRGRSIPAPPPGAATQPGIVALDAPLILAVTPSTAPAGIGAQVEITGTGFGPAAGNVTFFFDTNSPRIPAAVASWTDTRVVCDVPVGYVQGYPGSAASGPMIVTTSGGQASAPFQFGVPFGYGGYRWTSPIVAYTVDPAGVPDRETLVDAAAHTWSSAGAAFAFAKGNDPSSPYGANRMYWGPISDTGVIAMAQMHTSGGLVLHCEVEFSTSGGYVWGDGSGGTMDVQSIATHEMGHWLSLRDLYGAQDTSKVMYGYAATGSVKRALDPGDVAGVQWIYGDGSITPPVQVASSITIGASVSRSAYARPFVLSGILTPGGLGDPCVVEVRKPGSGRWSYSSKRLAYSGAGDWWYRYTPKLRGTYSFRARFEGDVGRSSSVSRTIGVTVR
jgi:hypothetical protein